MWNGSVYHGAARTVPYGSRAGTGTTPSCGENGEPERVAVFRLRGVDPTVALGVAGRRGRVYLAEGFFVELAGHPLHRLVQGGKGPRNCRRTFTRSGTVKAVTGLFITTRQGEIGVMLHPDTRITGFLRAGEPYLQVGDRITVSGRECAERTLWADRIRPAG